MPALAVRASSEVKKCWSSAAVGIGAGHSLKETPPTEALPLLVGRPEHDVPIGILSDHL